jgi:hypothetical protein
MLSVLTDGDSYCKTAKSRREDAGFSRDELNENGLDRSGRGRL